MNPVTEGLTDNVDRVSNHMSKLYLEVLVVVGGISFYSSLEYILFYLISASAHVHRGRPESQNLTLCTIYSTHQLHMCECKNLVRHQIQHQQKHISKLGPLASKCQNDKNWLSLVR